MNGVVSIYGNIIPTTVFDANNWIDIGTISGVKLPASNIRAYAQGVANNVDGSIRVTTDGRISARMSDRGCIFSITYI